MSRANPDSVFNSNVIGNATWGWGMVRDGATGTYVRTSDPQQVDTIPIAFLVAPKYLHDDGLRWFHVGTIHLDSLSKVKMNIEDDEGVVAFDAFKMTPHIAKEVIEYDHANRAVHSKVYSELTGSLPAALNPTGADLARTETFYAYDVAGHLVATRNVERVGSVQPSDSQFLLQYMDETPTTVGYAYQGNQQLLSFGLDESTVNYLKIKSFNLIGTSGDVLAVDPTSSGQLAQGANDQHSIWQFNNLDGTRFVDSQGWFPSDYAFAGQKLQSASSDFLLQSRDASRSTWGGGDGASFQSGGLIDSFANMNDTTMVLGTVGVSAALAVGIVATAPVSLPALTGGQLAFRAGGAVAGGAASAISEYQRGGDAMSVLAAGMGGAGSGGLNPFSGYGALVGGAAGAATAAVSGGDMSAGFQWGEMVGSFGGGGVGHYGTALAKYTAGGHGAKAVSKALQHTARSMSVEGAAMGAGAGIGAYYGGYDGALAGAQLGQLAGGVAANFLVACFTAGTPIVVDLEGNSRLIEELEVGDVVLTRNEFEPTGPLELKRIEEKFVRTAAVMEVVIRDRSIKTTAEHPFYVPLQGKFIAAGELKAGDELVGHSGQLVRIDSVSPLGEIATVYNFRVADHHTYFVGCDEWEFSIWTHNSYAGHRAASARHTEWAGSMQNINGSMVRLGRGALRRAGGDWQKAESLLAQYTEAMNSRFQRVGSTKRAYVDVAVENMSGKRNGDFGTRANPWNGDGSPKVGTSRIELGVVSTALEGHPVISAVDISYNYKKAFEWSKYTDAFGPRTTIADIRMSRNLRNPSDPILNNVEWRRGGDVFGRHDYGNRGLPLDWLQ